eukprot:1471312-Amphidinium_carterae.1
MAVSNPVSLVGPLCTWQETISIATHAHNTHDARRTTRRVLYIIIWMSATQRIVLSGKHCGITCDPKALEHTLLGKDAGMRRDRIRSCIWDAPLFT